MKGRLVFAALAAALLTACPKPDAKDQAYLVEKDGRFAIGIKHGARVELFPLPDPPVVIVNGELGGIQNVMAMPRCPCDRQECQIYCRPKWPLVTGGVGPTPPTPPPVVPTAPDPSAPSPANPDAVRPTAP